MPTVDPFSDIAHTIELAIAPVFLLTAAGTMLSVFSTRLGRIVDRARVLGDRLQAASKEQQKAYLSEIAVLARRRHLVNVSITCATVGALLVCVLIAVAFVGSMLNWGSALVIAGLFVAVMAAFIAALVFFLREILLAVAHLSELGRPSTRPSVE